MQHTKTATKIGASAAIAAAALIATATGASAATLNADGTGFVGKGEVQSAFGWNNAKIQDDHRRERAGVHLLRPRRAPRRSLTSRRLAGRHRARHADAHTACCPAP